MSEEKMKEYEKQYRRTYFRRKQERIHETIHERIQKKINLTHILEELKENNELKGVKIDAVISFIQDEAESYSHADDNGS